MSESKTPAIGVDLGTTYSCVGVFLHGRVEIVANDLGNRTMPSYVAFTDSQRLVGEAAKQQAARNTLGTIFDAKRLIGRQYHDETVQHDKKYWPFSVVSKREKLQVKVPVNGEGRCFTPEEISSMVLCKMKETAESFLGKKVKDAVITVPAYFNDSQRQATRDSGLIAGLNVLRIMNEPTAAALAYGLDKKADGQDRNILIFDLGGGTFDVSILSVADGSFFEVKATAGDTHLGGEDIDSRMVDYFVNEIKRKYKTDLRKNSRALRRLRTACESAKRSLSCTTEAVIEIDALFNGNDFCSKLTRARFEDLCIDLLQSCVKPVKRALRDAGLDYGDIDDIVLVGGSTRIPRIQRILQDLFKGKELNMSINPDEAVAYGAAVQAAVLSGDKTEVIQDVLLIDVTPLSLGVETAGGAMTTIIKRNSRIPASFAKDFTTYADNQTSVTIQVYEGERSLTKNNNLLETFHLAGIHPAPRGTPKVKVRFDLDTNGILNVYALDTTSGRSKQITITNDRDRFSKAEIDRILAEAKKFQAEDEARRKCLDAKNVFENYIASVKASMNSLGNKLTAIEKEKTESEVAKLLKWLAKRLDATQEEYEVKLNEAKKTFSPLMAKVQASKSREKSSCSNGT